MSQRVSRWKAQHVGCQKAVDNVKADLAAEIERLREGAALAYQALLWRGVGHDEDSERQAAAALDALRCLGLEPLYYRRVE